MVSYVKLGWSLTCLLHVSTSFFIFSLYYVCRKRLINQVYVNLCRIVLGLVSVGFLLFFGGEMGGGRKKLI